MQMMKNKDEGDGMDEIPTESRVSKKYTDKLTKIVVSIIMIYVFMIPILDTTL